MPVHELLPILAKTATAAAGVLVFSVAAYEFGHPLWRLARLKFDVSLVDKQARPVVVLGSRSKIKQRAVSEAFFQACGVRPTVVCCDAPSFVGDQPRSEAEAVAGAFNRTQFAREWSRLNAPSATFCIGIENGVWCQENGKMADVGVVYVSHKSAADTLYGLWASQPYELSEPLFLPSSSEMQKMNVHTATNGCWANTTDPHLLFSPDSRSRADYLREPLVRIVERIAVD